MASEIEGDVFEVEVKVGVAESPERMP